ncbi:MAG: dihydroorotate dehydrogenase electron transfer subunit [Pseudomonadota bacterium]
MRAHRVGADDPGRQTGRHPNRRGSICLESATVSAHQAFPADQFVMTLHAPRIAERATPGAFVHVQCDTSIPLRRPISLLGADSKTGQIELLYKRVGAGTTALAEQAIGAELSVLGPIGNGFSPNPNFRQALLLGGGVGIPPMVYLARELHREGGITPTVFMGSEVPFPFATGRAQVALPGVPTAVNATMTALDVLGIGARLASMAGFDGCHRGFVTDVARDWLRAQAPSVRNSVQVFACGPEPMLKASAALAAEFALNAYLCLEEYMACAVGGCAGCTVLVHDSGEQKMQRVCVDGPVFPARAIYPHVSP